jgi:hypothetical protein
VSELELIQVGPYTWRFKRRELPIARLRELLSYDPQTGELRWLVDHKNKTRPNGIAGYIRHDGYRTVGLDGGDIKAHRIAWALYYGGWPEHRIDHINRNPSDNRIANLRQVTHGQNIANTQSKIPGRTKGVYWHKQRQCWQSNITISGKKKHLGVFKTAAEAAAAFERASREIYGEFARVEAKPCDL